MSPAPGALPWLDPALLAPRPDLEWMATRLADGLAGGRHGSARRGRGVEFAQHRAYERGDDLRLVDWKAYGRTERLVIREAEVEAAHRFWLVLDASPSMAAPSPDTGHRKLDVARALAAGLAAVAERQGDDYGLAVPGAGVMPLLPAARGRPWLRRLLARLSTLEPVHRPGAPEAAPLARTLAGRERASEAVLVTDGYDDGGAWLGLVRELVAHGIATRMLALETRFERDWPVAKDRAFEDLETGRTVLSGAGGAAAYRAAREAHFARLRDALLGLGCPLARFDVDAPWDRQLRDWLGDRPLAPL